MAACVRWLFHFSHLSSQKYLKLFQFSSQSIKNLCLLLPRAMTHQRLMLSENHSYVWFWKCLHVSKQMYTAVNNNIIISKTMFMVLSSRQSHCESSPGSFDECRTAPSGRRPKTKPDDLGCESAYTGCQNQHPPSPFIISTQPESWYSFYRPTEGRRLIRPSWLVTYRDGLPVHRN